MIYQTQLLMMQQSYIINDKPSRAKHGNLHKLTKKIFKAGLRLLQFDILKERNLNADINAAQNACNPKSNLYTLES